MISKCKISSRNHFDGFQKHTNRSRAPLSSRNWRDRRVCCFQAAQSDDDRRRWQEDLAREIARRKGNVPGQGKQSNAGHGAPGGWQNTEIRQSGDKELDMLMERWRESDKKVPKEWQQNVKAGVVWTNIFGPAVGGLAVAVFGLLWTIIVWGTALVLCIPYALIRGSLIDISALSSALQIALVQFITVSFWAAYKGYEWTMTRGLTEEEKQRWREDQELKQLHLDELSDFDLRLTSEPRKDDRREIKMINLDKDWKNESRKKRSLKDQDWG